MADIRELWAAATHSSHLEHDAAREKPIDRIAAAAFSPRLGRVMWRYRYAGEAGAFVEAARLLAARFRRLWGVPQQSAEYVVLLRAARQALAEWDEPQCRVCDGRGEMQSESLRLVCPACGGSARHAYQSAERRHCVSASASIDWVRWEPRLAEMCEYVVAADQWVATQARRQLERDKR